MSFGGLFLFAADASPGSDTWDGGASASKEQALILQRVARDVTEIIGLRSLVWFLTPIDFFFL